MTHGVAANRMTLMRTRRRLQIARRGHTLMKHKLEELIRIFQLEVAHAHGLEDEAAHTMHGVYESFAMGSAQAEPSALAAILSAPTFDVRLEVTHEAALNLRLPVISCRIEGEEPPYGLPGTNADLDESTRKLRASIPLLLRLAQTRRRLTLLIDALESTRRRVNALEYVLVPQLEQEASLIQMKLDEIERSNVSRLMRIKSIVRKESEPA